MTFKKKVERNIVFVIMFVSLQFIATRAHATLAFYYDPDTGNVSFDTTETRSGELFIYQLDLNPHASSIRFRTENHILVTSSTATLSEEEKVAEVSFQPVSGLFTIGDILPAGLTESTWLNLFAEVGTGPYSETESTLGRHVFTDVIGGGIFPSPATFIYGRPEGEFDNKWDIVDPDTLEWATAAKLIYRQATGELVYDTSGENGGYTVGFYLRSDGQFLPEEFMAPWESQFNSASADHIDMLADAVEPGSYSLGNILEAGLSRAEYEALITDAHYISRAGFAGGDINLETDGIALSLVFEAVPEPTTALLMTIASSTILTRRRKRTLA